MENTQYAGSAAYIAGQGYVARGDPLDAMAHHQRELHGLESSLTDYMKTEAQLFLPYLNRQGKPFNGLDAVVSAELEDGIVAALMKYEQGGKTKSALIANARGEGWDSQLDHFADVYLGGKGYGAKEARNLAKRFVLSEEIYHETQSTDLQGEAAEIDAAYTLLGYFTDMSEKFEGAESDEYQALADVAQERYTQMTKKTN